MDFDKLRNFCTIIDCGNISKASEKLFLSQPALSKQIYSLEEEVGYALFDRVGKKLILNDNGTIFYNFAKNIIQDYGILMRELAIKNEPKNHEVCFGATNYIGTYLLPSIINQFKSSYPTIPISFSIHFLTDILDMLNRDLINFALVPDSPLIHNNKDYIAEYFMNDIFVLALPLNHPLTAKDKIYSKDLEEYPFLISSEKSATRSFIDKKFKEAKINLKHKIDLYNIMTIKNAIVDNLGISIISKKAIQNEINSNLILAREIEDLDLSRKLFILSKNRHIFFEEESLFIKQCIK